MKLLITSVGSLLGQNILDCIETRRELINVIGLNSVSKNPRNFRCDTIYKVSEIKSSTFEKEFLNIFQKEAPDLILPGRDEDCVFLADIKSKYPDKFKNSIPFGSSIVPNIMLDKYESFRFCKENHLPFAETFLYDKNKSDNLDKLSEFVEKYQYPLIAKPRQGFGSQGVRFILNRQHLEETIKDDNVVFQEYLGEPKDILKYQDAYKRGIPLFFQIPEPKQFASQSVINSDGSLSEIFFTVNTLVLGRNEYIEQLIDEEVERITQKFAKALFKNGWYGPLNIQMKQDKNGDWKAFELSPRQTGSTSGRLQLGFDEFGILCDYFIPEHKIPNLTKKQKVKGQVYKYLQDNIVLDADVSQLESKKLWKNPNSKNDK